MAVWPRLGIVSEFPGTHQARQAESVFTSALDAAWIQTMYYNLIFAAIEAVRSGTLRRHEAAEVVIRSLERGIGPD